MHIPYLEDIRTDPWEVEEEVVVGIQIAIVCNLVLHNQSLDVDDCKDRTRLVDLA